MAIIADNSTRPAVLDRSFGYGATHVENVWFTANTSEAIKHVMAPSGGILKEINVQGTVTSTATATYTIAVTNVSYSDAAMNATTLYDADPVLTAGTMASVTLSTTAANLAVDDGDLIAISHTGGTGSGAVVVQFVWELA